MMLTKIVSFVALYCLTTAGWTAEHSVYPSGQWIDLTYDFSPETIYWPTAEPFQLDTVSAGMTEKGYYYSAYKFCAAEHGGTHADAPIHFASGGKTIDQLPLTKLIAPAVKIDVSQKAMADRDYQISVEDFNTWESQYGKIPEGSIVLLQTGYGQYWPDRLKYLGTDKRGAEGVAELHFPGLHPEAAKWLASSRRINAIGIDTASIDYGQSQLFGSHVALTGQSTPVFENVANLDKVPTVGAQVIALPMKIKGGSGAPLRIIAFTPDGAH
ncbi:cyclase family protein [Methylobacter sp. YRD-M1]|uniref:cyclase family protein n=1 Tax=Methylobacter sp. YRD-M1 TaxID=2911520 RepID=UPI00227A6E89|nr:cyclase family protein [Methylobacter sp. YRD-M1]WAK01912.1 cyclase family protein [Methylobacter sp. YRD-M1]